MRLLAPVLRAASERKPKAPITVSAIDIPKSIAIATAAFSASLLLWRSTWRRSWPVSIGSPCVRLGGLIGASVSGTQHRSRHCRSTKTQTLPTVIYITVSADSLFTKPLTLGFSSNRRDSCQHRLLPCRAARGLVPLDPAPHYLSVWRNGFSDGCHKKPLRPF